ncbi:hypothetical protein TWF481_006193 [Arthrobotrys musiformis]|uniref:Uncharacterized protein n=1 Tax=Arthrobotrys musiformis TaxID=47236 RepID=A0AAV9WGI9_9PEZI
MVALRASRDWFRDVNTRAEFLIAYNSIVATPANSNLRSSREGVEAAPSFTEAKTLSMNPAEPLTEKVVKERKESRRQEYNLETALEPSFYELGPSQGTRGTLRANAAGLTRPRPGQISDQAGKGLATTMESSPFIDSLLSYGGAALLSQQEIANRQLESELKFLSNDELVKLQQHPMHLLPSFQLADLLLRRRLERELRELPADERETEVRIRVTVAEYERDGETGSDPSEASENDESKFDEYLNFLIHQTTSQGTSGRIEEEYDAEIGEDIEEEIEDQIEDQIEEKIEEENIRGSENAGLKLGEDNENLQHHRANIEALEGNTQRNALESQDRLRGRYRNEPIKIEVDSTDIQAEPGRVAQDIDTFGINARIESLLPRLQMSELGPDMRPAQAQVDDDTVIKEEDLATPRGEGDIDVKIEGLEEEGA